MAICEAEEPIIKSPAVVLSGEPGPPLPPPSGDLQPTQAGVIAEVQAKLDTTVFRLLVGTKTQAEFVELRAELYPTYVTLASEMAAIIRAGIENQSKQEVLEKAFDALEQILSSDTNFCIDQDGSREEALFDLDALRRAHVLLLQISDTPVSEDLSAVDSSLIVRCLQGLWFSQLHLRCILFAMVNQTALPTREVKDAVMEGLRSSLGAYVAVSQAWKLRFEATQEPQSTEKRSGIDPEEESLLNEAEADDHYLMNREQSRASADAETR